MNQFQYGRNILTMKLYKLLFNYYSSPYTLNRITIIAISKEELRKQFVDIISCSYRSEFLQEHEWKRCIDDITEIDSFVFRQHVELK
jgi:hypothetical protein